tara:strand:+ start:830 stop:2626 length:1797 start_codon:yes stop_codon:yes gene_type:complete
MGMDSSVENRPMLIPIREEGEWIAPEWFHSMARGAMVPFQYVLGGTVTPLDTAMAIADYAGGGLLSSKAIPNAVPDGPVLGATVWHGSPHKFDKFDMSKIGTGEGAQAYGHGLYFAENPNVAKSYAEALGAKVNMGIPRSRLISQGPTKAEMKAVNEANKRMASSFDSISVDDYVGTGDPRYKPEPFHTYYDYYNARNDLKYRDELYYMQNQEKVDKRIKSLENKYKNDKNFKKKFHEFMGEDAKPNWEHLKTPYATSYDSASSAMGEIGQSHLYKVDIPDEHIDKMLDLDKPLSEQKSVMLKLNNQAKNDAVLADILKDIDKEGRGVGGTKYRGEDLLRDYESYGGLSQPEISNRLQQQGIKGIKYLDGGSRDAGKGTQNFVVFDDQIPQILEINDKSIATGPLSKKKWYGGKDPTQLTEDEFIKTHKTGTIPHGAYDRKGWWGTDIKANPKLIKTIDTPQGKVEFRKSGIKNRYTKFIGDGPNREIARGDDGLALSLSDSEIKAKGYPVEDQTITAFLNGEPIGYASNEFGAVGVFLNPKGPRRFHGDSIGTELLTEFMKENPHMQMGQMTYSGERTARKTHKKLTNMMRGMLSGQ